MGAAKAIIAKDDFRDFPKVHATNKQKASIFSDADIATMKTKCEEIADKKNIRTEYDELVVMQTELKKNDRYVAWPT